MEKIHSLQQLEDCLKAHSIVCTADKKGMLYAIQHKDGVRVQNDYSAFCSFNGRLSCIIWQSDLLYL